MSDISDVLNVLTAQCSAFVYPNGTSQPSVCGSMVKVYPGWPTASSLDQDLQAGTVNVSIFPAGQERNTTRYRPKQSVMSVAAATITLVSAGSTLTVGGAMPSPFTLHNVAALIAGQAFIYPVQASDTLTSIATGLSALIAAKYPGTVNSGTVITLPAGVRVTAARVGTSGQISTEWERQDQRIQITVWAPDPTTRTAVSAAIKTAFAQISNLTMPDGYGSNIKPAGSLLSDVLEKAKTYRRDLFYLVEYATTVTQQIATVVAAELIFEDMQGDPLASRTY